MARAVGVNVNGALTCGVGSVAVLYQLVACFGEYHLSCNGGVAIVGKEHGRAVVGSNEGGEVVCYELGYLRGNILHDVVVSVDLACLRFDNGGVELRPINGQHIVVAACCAAYEANSYPIAASAVRCPALATYVVVRLETSVAVRVVPL